MNKYVALQWSDDGVEIFAIREHETDEQAIRRVIREETTGMKYLPCMVWPAGGELREIEAPDIFSNEMAATIHIVTPNP